MLRDFRENKRFFFIVLVVLFLSFSINFFGTLSTDMFVGGGKDSESLVSNQIVCEGRLFHNQLIGPRSGIAAIVEENQCNEQVLSPYTSQFGLQGRTYTFVYQILHSVTNMPPLVYISLAQLATALATAAVYSLIALWVRSRFTVFVGSVFSAFVAISPMIVGHSHNLYWAEALMVLPLVFTLYLYRYYSALKVSKKVLFWIGLGGLLYIRYLCGYEYLTTLAIMPLAVVGYYLYLEKAAVKEYIQQFALALGVAIVAFFGALTTHVLALNSSTGSTGSSINIIRGSAQSRTVSIDQYIGAPYDRLSVLLPDHYQVTDTYLGYESHKERGSKFWSILVAISTYMLLPVIHVPLEFAPSFSTYLQSTTVFIIVLALLFRARKRLREKKLFREVEALYLSLVIGLIGYFSWFVFALPHSIVHSHINGILMYLPFALFGYVIIGLWIQSLFIKTGWIRRRK